MSGLEISSALFSATSVLHKAVVYGDQLCAAADEMNVARALMDTITSAMVDVISARSRLAHLLPISQRERINQMLTQTEKFVSLVKKVVKSEEDIEKASTMTRAGFTIKWALRDNKRVLSYQSVLMCLHGALIVTRQELGVLRKEAGIPWDEEKTEDSDSNDSSEYTFRSRPKRKKYYITSTSPPPPYERIYSYESEKQVIEELDKWEKQEDPEGTGTIHSSNCARRVKDDFERFRFAKYSDSGNNFMIEEVKRRRKERDEAKRSPTTVSMESYSIALAKEVRRRRQERGEAVG